MPVADGCAPAFSPRCNQTAIGKNQDKVMPVNHRRDKQDADGIGLPSTTIACVIQHGASFMTKPFRAGAERATERGQKSYWHVRSVRSAILLRQLHLRNDAFLQQGPPVGQDLP